MSQTPTTDWSAPESQPPFVPLALVNGLLIDGTGDDPVSNAVVLVKDGRIQAAGSRADVTVPPEYQMVDVQGATVLPGLINAHVHHAYDIQRLKTWAQAGVTTVREMGLPTTGMSMSERYALRDRSRSDPQLARIVSATLNFTGPRGYGQAYVDSPADARTKVLNAIDEGAEVAKYSFENYRPLLTFWPLMPLQDGQAVAAAAHERGVRAAVHITRARLAQRAIDSGADEIEHMPSTALSDDVIRRAVAADVLWVPTLELWHVVGKEALPKVMGDRAPMFFTKGAIDNLRRFLAAGGRVALGTDYGGSDGEVNRMFETGSLAGTFQLGLPMLEMELMQEAGMTPLQVLVAATKNGAFACGKSEELGTIEPGKSADILVVNGNPLDDLHRLQDVRMVIKNGLTIRGEENNSALACLTSASSGRRELDSSHRA